MLMDRIRAAWAVAAASIKSGYSRLKRASVGGQVNPLGVPGRVHVPMPRGIWPGWVPVQRSRHRVAMDKRAARARR